jgi:hypothetical protein
MTLVRSGSGMSAMLLSSTLAKGSARSFAPLIQAEQLTPPVGRHYGHTTASPSRPARHSKPGHNSRQQVMEPARTLIPLPCRPVPATSSLRAAATRAPNLRSSTE